MSAKMESYLSLAIAKSRTSSELSTSSEESDLKKRPQEIRRLEAKHEGWQEIHGFRGNINWNAPCQLNHDVDQTLDTSLRSKKYHDYEDE